MRTLLIVITFCCSAVTTFGQNKYEPQILILSPNVVTYDKTFEKEILTYNDNLNKNRDNSNVNYEDTEEFKKYPENIQLMLKSEIAFSKNLDLFKEASYMSEQMIGYSLFELFPNLLIKLKDLKSDSSLIDLKKISENENMQYVLNFSSINIYKDASGSFANITMQLYDKSSNSNIINKVYKGNGTNPGSAFLCVEKSVHCMINNALSFALDDVISILALKNTKVKKEAQQYTADKETQQISVINNDEFIAFMTNNIFIPAYEHEIKSNPSDFSEYTTLYDELTLIFPTDKKVVLNPIMITNKKGEQTLRFYLAFKDKKDVYEWTYFKPNPIPVKNTHYGVYILEQLNTITKWDFSFKTLDDEDFWNNYVLKKDGDKYMYLTPIE